jgi:hypothetical protein
LKGSHGFFGITTKPTTTKKSTAVGSIELLSDYYEQPRTGRKLSTLLSFPADSKISFEMKVSENSS